MSSFERVSSQQLKSMLHDGGELALLDVREAGQFGMSHLLFATSLPYGRLELQAGGLVPRPATRIVLCDDGKLDIASRAAARLQAQGYTDVSILDGGTSAWRAAGYALFAGVNVPSKAFGELVEHTYRTPCISAQHLQAMKARGEDLVILDGRPYAEYHAMNIPGSVCCPNAELPYRIAGIVKDPKTTIVVNCAGRTRSIIGAQTLINVGIRNPVYALENGTQGWVLANFGLERGATRKYPDEVDAPALSAMRISAKRLMTRFSIDAVSAQQVSAWLEDVHRTTYLCDVRTAEEFAARSIPASVHAPGGQLIQATDQWIGVRNARIVLIDGEGVRAPVVASWLKQLGCDVYVLDGGIRSGLEGKPAPQPILPPLPLVSGDELKREVDGSRCTVFDVGASHRYRNVHVPGSRWTSRARIAADARGVTRPIVLVADDVEVARLVALDLADAGFTALRALEGGFAAWTAAGYATESTPAVPPDDECIDYLYFVHDRHAGNRDAMRQYLAWETGLVAQLDEQDKSLFRINHTPPGTA